MALFNNDRVSHWYLGAVFGWTIAVLLFGLPIFHLLFAVSIFKVAVSGAICCAIQCLILPWLFSARATPQNPQGRIAQRGAAVVVWYSITLILLFEYVSLSWVHDSQFREFRAILLSTIAGLAVLGFVALGIFARRQKDIVTR